jgi:hypothetical protein
LTAVTAAESKRRRLVLPLARDHTFREGNCRLIGAIYLASAGKFEFFNRIGRDFQFADCTDS